MRITIGVPRQQGRVPRLSLSRQGAAAYSKSLLFVSSEPVVSITMVADKKVAMGLWAVVCHCQDVMISLDHNNLRGPLARLCFTLGRFQAFP